MSAAQIISLFIFLSVVGCDNTREFAEPIDSKKAETSITVKDTVQQNYVTNNDDDDVNKKSKSVDGKISETESYDSGIKSISQLWQTYKKAKSKIDQYVNTNKLDTVIHYLKIAGECAVELGRPGIAAWQFNNIGHYSILAFKERTNYDVRIRDLATLNDESARSLLLTETKSTFKQHLGLLTKSLRYLEEAQILDDEMEPSDRTATIESNIEFITWVKEFASN